MAERWRKIKGYEELYSVSNKGNVQNIKRKTILSPGTIPKGYMFVKLSKNNIPKTKYIHRLVAEAFIPNPKNKPEVNHIYGNKKNNKVWNLEWVTSSENHKHAFRTGLKTQKGKKNNNYKGKTIFK